MLITKIQKGNSILRPRARLIKTIGEELISSDIVALLELVKNSYDADATIIVIEFNGRVVIEKDGKKEIRKIIKEGSSVQVYDDGTGMTLDTIKEAWMEPATISKKGSIKSEGKKRRYTGEKGIGRFSSAKLSSQLEIITRFESDTEVVADFNWKEFEDIDLYLFPNNHTKKSNVF
jgi:HSP90 family molecular chaperone